MESHPLETQCPIAVVYGDVLSMPASSDAEACAESDCEGEPLWEGEPLLEWWALADAASDMSAV